MTDFEEEKLLNDFERASSLEFPLGTDTPIEICIGFSETEKDKVCITRSCPGTSNTVH